MPVNSRDNPPPFDPKHRIVGAVILVALAVIFVPMLLDKRPEPPAVEPIIEIPSTDSKVITSPVPALEPAPVPTLVAPASPSEAAATEPPPAVPEKPAVAESKPDKPATAAKPAKTETKSATKVEKGWVVQVGAFASSDNAIHLRDKLRKQGYPAEIDNIVVDAKTMVRVRVGPYRDTASAKAMQARLQNDAALKGVVLAYP